MFKIELAKLLKERGVTQYRLAKDTGIGQSTISNWLVAGTQPTIETAQQVADYFGVSVDYLTGREDKERPAAGSDEPEVKSVYLSLAKDMQTRGIHPDDIRDMMDLLEKRHNRNDQG